MPGVTKDIKSYFKPINSPMKRKSEGSLTPDQKRRMTCSKIASKILLASKELPILDKGMGASWFEALEPHFKTESFKALSAFVSRERSSGGKEIYPPADKVWSWTSFFPIQETKVVILGQDPYHGPRQAHGLCFSVLPGVSPPPSLRNMFKELESDVSGFKRPGHGNLSGWASQGVLLLNAVLTVRKAEANSHKDKGWENLTDAVIKYISEHCKGVVFLLWGSYAQKKGAHVDGKRHHLLKSVHPSPLSAHRGFLGCKHFSKANELLKEQGKEPIDWSLLPRDIE